eukprot:TRINITY_DN4235_c1_g1_i1.p1 TRINITY_DN4235_c1_g1~~TRINITY_DN4235_c1_g1_i1.p1  ORF type:complete len:281 (-),score=42.73 TRINITY_DN4235_c1_g1_i1:33-875(-)
MATKIIKNLTSLLARRLEVYNVKGVTEPNSLPNAERPIPTEKPPGAVRFVCLSDTHGLLDKREFDVPPGDVLLHAGDFTNTGEQRQVQRFSEWMESQPHRYKIFIAGNHDITLDLAYYRTKSKRFHSKPFPAEEIKAAILANKKIIYLEDSETTICDGIRVYGSPWQPEFCDWAFNVNRGKEIKKYWDQIPNGIDVLVTHGPPTGHGGFCNNGLEAGCDDLLNAVQRVKPAVHIFGHIHEGYGVTEDKHTVYINASNCTYFYKCKNNPIVFDLFPKTTVQ